MSGPQPGSGTITCPHCQRRIPWREALEGKRIKCNCGNVFEGILDLDDGPLEANTYDLAPDEVNGSQLSPLSSATSAPMPSASALSDGRVLSYAHARPEEIAERKLHSPIREFYLPIGLLLLGVAFRAAQVIFDSGAGSAGVAGTIGAAVVGVGLNIGLTLAAVFIAAKLLAVDFGSIGSIILKVTAMAVLAGAVGALIVSVSPKDITAPIVALHVVVILYWVMFYNFFEIDLQETMLTTAIVTMFQIAAFCVVFKPLGK